MVACEYSGTVRDAFLARGHDAVSCDLLPTDSPGPHYQGDIRDLLSKPWDLMIAHPPCTFLANSSAKHLYLGMNKMNGPNHERLNGLHAGALFFKMIWQANIPKICVENPIMLGLAKRIIGASQTQLIQPWQHGHGETKATCLWLKNLPKLVPSNVVEGRVQRVHLMGPSPTRWKERSTTYPGIAKAFAEQWG